MTQKLHPSLLGRYSVAEARASNAITFTLKDEYGGTISTDNPVFVEFQSSTETSSVKVVRKLTAPISWTGRSGDTFGHASGILQHLFLYLIDVGDGSVEIAGSNLPPDYPGTFLNKRLISTTQNSSGGAVTSATTIYSTTARTNVAWVPLAMVKSNQAAAGTWVTQPSRIDMAPFTIPTCAFSAGVSGAQAIPHNAATKVVRNVEDYDPDTVYDAVTNYRYQPNVAGVYHIGGTTSLGSLSDTNLHITIISKNGSAIAQQRIAIGSATDSYLGSPPQSFLANGTSDYFELMAYHNQGSDRNTIGSSTIDKFFGQRVQGGKS